MMDDYDLELDKVADKIISEKAKIVLIQLPDGLKPKANEIKDYLKNKIDKNTKLLFWAGSCFGACDVPVQAEKLGIDLIIQFGHSEWR
ncbi:MAG TPA: diphthamide synthesis protein [Candidatus Nanoarchaeia archaeon]|nr:diphthamide synthesis protein [Candidatus Nanoarchaeia archaeon]